MLRIGVIGAGRISRIHIENLTHHVSKADVVAVADPHLQAAEKAADRFQIPSALADYGEILNDPTIHAVVICSPSPTHPRIIRESAAAEKHIFCEKPIGFDLKEIDLALAAVEKTGVKLQIGFNRRFDANFHRVWEMVNAGKVGTPHVLRITSRDPEPPSPDYVRSWGGIFLETSIHDFDMARYIMSSEVVEIYATGGVLVHSRFADSGDLDTVILTMRFANGAIGTIDNSYQAVYGYDQRLEVLGDAGMIHIENNTPDTHIYADTTGIHSALPLYFFLERYQASYLAEMKEFVAAIEKDTQPLVGGVDGRASIVMALAARKSYDEHRVVRLSEFD
jgi:myo-inositol 2-dehydrogenase/D-chiro-inositol 1-dehydrogenase